MGTSFTRKVSSELTLYFNSYISLVNVIDVAGLKSNCFCFNPVRRATLKNRKQTTPLTRHTDNSSVFSIRKAYWNSNIDLKIPGAITEIGLTITCGCFALPSILKVIPINPRSRPFPNTCPIIGKSPNKRFKP